MKGNAPRQVRRATPLLGLLPVALAAAGIVAANSWQERHLQTITGRAEPGSVLCTYCHRDIQMPARRDELDAVPYLSPVGLAVSPDGRTLYVTTGPAGRLLRVDTARGEVTGSIALAGHPHGVAISGDGGRLAVSCSSADRIVVLDADTLKVQQELRGGAEPLGIALSAAGDRVFVANGATDVVSILPVEPAPEAVRLATGNEPYAVALSADGGLLAVAARLARPVPPQVVPASEMTLVDARAGRILDRRSLVSAHLSEGVAVASDGSFALATALHVRNLLPLTQVARGGVMNSTLVYVETGPGGRTLQFPLDEVNAFYADPSGVVMTPDDRLAFVAHGGSQVVTAVDVPALRRVAAERNAADLAELPDDLGISGRYVLGRIPTRDNPRALAISPDGGRVFVAERLADSIAVIDTAELRVVRRIELGGPAELTSERRGERVFHDATGTFQGQFSCRSCHPEGSSDGLIWDFEIDGIGRNLVDTRSLRGVRDTAPFKWNGKNPDLATQCGPRFARVLTRSEPFTPDQLADLVSFIESIPLPPRRVPEELARALEEGRRIFFRVHANDGSEIPVANRCETCHRPPLYTDRLKTDVGTGGAFDAPHLLDVASSAPYLHDGRAMTLEEIWTVHSPEDTHGVTTDLTKAQLNDLVIFLRSL